MASSTGAPSEATGKMKALGVLGGDEAEAYVRADKIVLEELDIQLDKQLAKRLEKNKGKSQGPMEDWEIDLSKLEIRRVTAQGTYGTVYRGTYDGQDVAGILPSFIQLSFCSSSLLCVYEIMLV